MMTNDEGISEDDVRRDGTPLSQVWRTLELCGSGLHTHEVADRLGVDPDTVQRRVERAKHLLGARSKLEAVVKAIRLGLIDPSRCDGE
jgi:DNA-binding NarL/FixJ family response regulator